MEGAEGVGTLASIAGPATLRLEIERAAQSDANVLATGDRGTGKEIIARVIHRASARCRGAFLTVDCAGLPELQLKADLFGYVEGDFGRNTGDRIGTIHRADNGTLYLDEVGDLPPSIQALLLRFLESGKILRAGADQLEGPIDVRIIAASSRSLRDQVERGLFDEQLYDRLSTLTVRVPPLRERRADILELVERLSRRHAQGERGPFWLDRVSLDALLNYSWPGNVRELEQLMNELAASRTSDVITVKHLPRAIVVAPETVVRPIRDRRQSVADYLYHAMVGEQRSFFDLVYPLYLQREITRDELRDLVHKGLECTRGSYKLLTRLFNIEAGSYKRFLGFLRKQDCLLPFMPYRR